MGFSATVLTQALCYTIWNLNNCALHKSGILLFAEAVNILSLTRNICNTAYFDKQVQMFHSHNYTVRNEAEISSRHLNVVIMSANLSLRYNESGLKIKIFMTCTF